MLETFTKYSILEVVYLMKVLEWFKVTGNPSRKTESNFIKF